LLDLFIDGGLRVDERDGEWSFLIRHIPEPASFPFLFLFFTFCFLPWSFFWGFTSPTVIIGRVGPGKIRMKDGYMFVCRLVPVYLIGRFGMEYVYIKLIFGGSFCFFLLSFFLCSMGWSVE